MDGSTSLLQQSVSSQEGYFDYSQNNPGHQAVSNAPGPSMNTYQTPTKKIIQKSIVKSENPTFKNKMTPAIVDTFSLPKVKKENPTIKRENQNFGMMAAASMNAAGPSFDSEYESPNKKARNTPFVSSYYSFSACFHIAMCLKCQNGKTYFKENHDQSPKVQRSSLCDCRGRSL